MPWNMMCDGTHSTRAGSDLSLECCETAAADVPDVVAGKGL